MTNDRFSNILNREAMRMVKATTAAVAWNTTGNVTLLNLSGGVRGVLKYLGWLVTTTLTGAPVFTLTITIDGGTPVVLSIFNGSTAIQAEMRALAKELHDGTPITTGEGAGFDLGDLPFNSSCSVVLNRTTGGSAGAADMTVVYELPA